MNILEVVLAVLASSAVTAATEGNSDDGLVVRTVKEAKSCERAAEVGDRLRVHYVGRLEGEDGEIFDESRPRGQTFDFTLGMGQVIANVSKVTIFQQRCRFSIKLVFNLLDHPVPP